MQEIQDYFDILTAEGREIMPKVFIATDEPKIIDEIHTKVNIKDWLVTSDEQDN